MKTAILLEINCDGERCGACAWVRYGGYWIEPSCALWDDNGRRGGPKTEMSDEGPLRHPACLAAEQRAREPRP